MEHVCALFDLLAAQGTPVWDRCLVHVVEKVLIGTDRLSSELDTSSGFQKPYSSDAMIAGALKSFWYV